MEPITGIDEGLGLNKKQINVLESALNFYNAEDVIEI
jgi:hypothetical protein